MSNHNSRIVNRRLAASSIVRPIEAIKQPIPGSDQQRKNVILKPKPKPNKNLPGTKLLIKLAQERQKQKSIKERDKNESDMIEKVIDDIVNDLL
jgi:hypothetical protein